MSKFWRGPTEALKATYADSIASRLHRRAGEQRIAYETDHTGRTAKVWRVEKRGEQWYQIDLGTVRGDDPMNTFINVALAYTDHDPELFSLIGRQLERRTDEILSSLSDLDKRLPVALEDIEIAHASLAHYV